MADAPATPATAAGPAEGTATPDPGPSSAPGQGQTAPSAPPTAEAEFDPSVPPRHADLEAWQRRHAEVGKWAARTKAQEDERAARDADARDAAAYRAMLAQGFTPRQAQAEAAKPQGNRWDGLDPNDFDDIAGRFASPSELRAWINNLAKHVANPQAGRLHREVQQLRGQLPQDFEAVRQKVEQLAQEREAERRAATDRSFVEGTEAKGDDGALRYPLLARHPRNQRFAIANQVIADYRNAGYDGQLSIDDVLAAAEEQLAKHYQELGFVPAPAPAALPEDKQAPTTKRSPSRPAPRSSPGSRTMTNDLAATESAPKPSDPKQVDEWVIKQHARRKAARSARAG